MNGRISRSPGLNHLKALGLVRLVQICISYKHIIHAYIYELIQSADPGVAYDQHLEALVRVRLLIHIYIHIYIHI